jgi:cytochrome P450
MADRAALAPLHAAADLDVLFEEFRRIGDPEAPDPHPLWAELRRKGPVHRFELFGAAEGVVVLGYDALARVFRDAETFSSAGYARSVGLLFGHSILEMDPPEHTRYRALVQQAFTRRALEAWRERLVVPWAEHLVRAFAGRGAADLTRELCFPFPLEVIAGLLGVPGEDRLRYFRWSIGILAAASDPGVAMGAAREMGEYFAPRIDAARGRTGSDLVTLLANAELDGERLSTEEILPFLRLLSPAGFETTSRALSNLLCGLLSHPEQLAALREDRSLLPAAIHEGLRWEPPLVAFGRTARRDVELAGLPIAAGTPIGCLVGAANRDETRWEDPDRFDLHRPPKAHLAFALGPHTCLGMHLALMELEVALETLLDRLPDLALSPGAAGVRVRGGSFRTAYELPVTFRARNPARP